MGLKEKSDFYRGGRQSERGKEELGFKLREEENGDPQIRNIYIYHQHQKRKEQSDSPGFKNFGREGQEVMEDDRIGRQRNKLSTTKRGQKRFDWNEECVSRDNDRRSVNTDCGLRGRRGRRDA